MPFLTSDSNAQEVLSRLLELGSTMHVAANGTFRVIAEEIKERMSVEGDPRSPEEPVNWDTEKQRKAYFASDGFGHGIPYVRQHTYENSYFVSDSVDGGVALAAPHPAGAIGGMPGTGWQSNIHRGRWPNIMVVLGEVLPKLVPEFLRQLRIETQ